MSALTVAEVLSRAADLIEPAGKWTQGEWESPDGCLCAEGALWKAGAADVPAMVWASPAGETLSKTIRGSIVDFNDAVGRTQPEVVAKLREAAALAREQGL